METTYRLAFESFGICAEVLSDDEELFEQVPQFLPPGWRPAGEKPVQVTFTVDGDGSVTVDEATVAGPGGWFSPLFALGDAIQHHVAERAPDHVFIHAGVVGVGDVGIVIPGASMSGKSTLVAELVHAGATYYSDEYAAIDAGGMVHGYARALSLRFDPEQGLGGGTVDVPPEQTGAIAVRAGLVVVTGYEPGAAWEPRVVSPGEGALALLTNTVVARSRPAQALAATRRVAHGARTIASPRGEAEPVARALVRLAREQLAGPFQAPEASVT